MSMVVALTGIEPAERRGSVGDLRVQQLQIALPGIGATFLQCVSAGAASFLINHLDPKSRMAGRVAGCGLGTVGMGAGT